MERGVAGAPTTLLAGAGLPRAAGRDVAEQAGSAAPNKGVEWPLHVCIATAGPAGSALRRESRPERPRGSSALLLPGGPGWKEGVSAPFRGPGASSLRGNEVVAAPGGGAPCGASILARALHGPPVRLGFAPAAQRGPARPLHAPRHRRPKVTVAGAGLRYGPH